MTCDLRKSSNGCEITNCINTVKFLKSTGVSNSMIIIAAMKEDSKYEDKYIPKILIKLYVAPDKKLLSSERYIDSKGLEYESFIYSQVIYPLVHNKICPNFVNYMIQGVNCSSKILNNLFNKAHISLNISKLSITKKINPRYIPYLKYNLFVTEYTEGKKMSDIHNKVSTQDLWEMIFQLAYACYCLTLSGTVHNDLHSGNIFVEEFSKPKSIMYVDDGDIYYLPKCKRKVLIFDFDRAYTPRFGENKYLDDYFCDNWGQCSKVSNNKDILKVLVTMSVKHPDLADSIIDLILKDKSMLWKIESFFKPRKYKNVDIKNVSFFQNSRHAKRFVISNLELEYIFYSGKEILKRIGKKAGYLLEKHAPIKKDTELYLVSKSFFNKDGNIKTGNIKKTRSDFKQEYLSRLKLNLVDILQTI